MGEAYTPFTASAIAKAFSTTRIEINIKTNSLGCNHNNAR